MDAPLAENIIRLATAAMASAATGSLIYLVKVSSGHPEWWLLAYLAVIVFVQTIYRWFVFWVGLQSGDVLFGQHYDTTIEPWVRVTGSGLLFLLFFGIALLSTFTARGKRAR